MKKILLDTYAIFCVASEGYAEHFIHKRIHPEKIAITGLPDSRTSTNGVRANINGNNSLQKYLRRITIAVVY